MVYQWAITVFFRNMTASVGDLVVTGYGLMFWNDAANQTVSKETRKHWCRAFTIIQLTHNTNQLTMWPILETIQNIRP